MRNPLVISRIEDEVRQGMQRKGHAQTDPRSAEAVESVLARFPSAS